MSPWARSNVGPTKSISIDRKGVSDGGNRSSVVKVIAKTIHCDCKNNTLRLQKQLAVELRVQG